MHRATAIGGGQGRSHITAVDEVYWHSNLGTTQELGQHRAWDNNTTVVFGPLGGRLTECRPWTWWRPWYPDEGVGPCRPGVG